MSIIVVLMECYASHNPILVHTVVIEENVMKNLFYRTIVVTEPFIILVPSLNHSIAIIRGTLYRYVISMVASKIIHAMPYLINVFKKLEIMKAGGYGKLHRELDL
ncbi:MAG: hypothetical protein QXW70_02095 [Candidatus Anstonellales archaeon]